MADLHVLSRKDKTRCLIINLITKRQRGGVEVTITGVCRVHRFRQLSVFSTCLTVDATNEPVGRFYYQMKYRKSELLVH